MSVSILIPTYNYDCSELIKVLLNQANSLSEEYELIVGDDGSTDGNIVNNLITTCSISKNCRLLRVKKNLGRAGIRNRMGHEASKENLLFMDSDAEVVDSNFLRDYILAIKDHPIVSGFISQPPECPSIDMMLRYNYEKSYGSHHSASRLNKMTHPPLSTFCFMIKKELFDSVQFDDSFMDYGYEDVMYGMRLRKLGYRVFYIDTPLQHNGMETNSKFIEKTERALRTLKKHEEELKDDVHLLHVVNELHKFRFAGLVRIVLKPFLSKLRNNLCSSDAKLRWLNVYKLGYYLNS